MSADVAAAPPALPVDADALRDRLRRAAGFPASTYRLQMHGAFTFRDATAIVPYLVRLGVGAVYCSPYLKSRPGSTHGYDICDHGKLDPEIGNEEDYAAFVAALQAHGLRQVLDIVPNHMAADPVENPWWRDVLENGRSSPYAAFFDIDWEPLKAELRGKVLLPVLGDHYGAVLERGELKVAFANGALAVRYFDNDLPTDPRQASLILRVPTSALDLAHEDDPDTREFLSIMTALERLPIATAAAPERMAERRREKEIARERLLRLAGASERVRRHIEECLAAANGTPGDPASFDRLHEFLEVQPYRLAYWKTAPHEINYRRFFDINGLAGVRVEDPSVFHAAHKLILQLVRDGRVNGLRLDHIDGLYDPTGYVQRLQEEVVVAHAEALLGHPPEDADAFRAAVVAWREEECQREPGGPAEKPVYLLAEKILTGPERLPPTWLLHGTSGYDFMNDVNRLFVSDNGLRLLGKTYERFVGEPVKFLPMIYECKRLIVGTSMAGELNVLAHALNRLSERGRRSRDFTLNALRIALREIVAHFPVYRTYVTPTGVAEADRRAIDQAVRKAKRMSPAAETSIFDFLRGVLLPFGAEGMSEDEFRRRITFTMKFQQYTGPVQAKGVEDTAFYRYNRLLSLNEVGGEPHHGGLTPAQFHEAGARRQRDWPHGMLATATHDTKRGEDARARLNVLSELPVEWSRIVFRFMRINARHRADAEGEPAPGRNDEYLFYQALLGAWPAEADDAPVPAKAPPELVERLVEYMTKAMKEAKVRTSWISPDEEYDKAVTAFVRGTLTTASAKRFLAVFVPFQRRVARLGMVNALAQTVLKVATPGVPDFYQGTELWDLSLVDPDNRRPVDFTLRTKLLDEAASADMKDLLAHWHDGRVKLAVTARGLALRKANPELFQEGEYVPLEIVGDQADHVVAFLRRRGDAAVLAVAPRLSAALTTPERPIPCGPDAWGETRVILPDGVSRRALVNVLTGERLDNSGGLLVALLRDCPVGLFRAE
jgi:(1->4)-alpha-D-glucan 1-alpha-D-glucosylmutase